MAGKRYYWLKLNKDFFKRHDIRILESMPNGHETVLFYLKLLCEAVDHNGALRFSMEVPYDDEMLASVTNTDLQVVKKAMETFKKLGLVGVDDYNTIHMHNVVNMLGSAADNDNANRQRRFREKQAAGAGAQNEDALQNVTDTVTKNNACVTKNNAPVTVPVTKRNESIDIEKELDIEKDIELELDRKKGNAGAAAKSTRPAARFCKPTIEEVTAYCKERGNSVNPQAFWDFYEAVGWRVGNKSMRDWRACVRTWETREKETQKQKPQKAQDWRDIPIMENKYDFTPAGIKAKEQKALDDLDALLAEE